MNADCVSASDKVHLYARRTLGTGTGRLPRGFRAILLEFRLHGRRVRGDFTPDPAGLSLIYPGGTWKMGEQYRTSGVWCRVRALHQSTACGRRPAAGAVDTGGTPCFTAAPWIDLAASLLGPAPRRAKRCGRAKHVHLLNVGSVL